MRFLIVVKAQTARTVISQTTFQISAVKNASDLYLSIAAAGFSTQVMKRASGADVRPAADEAFSAALR